MIVSRATWDFHLAWFWAQVAIAGVLTHTAWLERDREETHATIRAILAMRDPPARRYP